MSQKPSIKPGKLSIALLVSSTLMAIVAQLFVALPAQACEFQGQQYTAGAVVGPYICMPDGTWKRND
jgi:hypothetical protein